MVRHLHVSEDSALLKEIYRQVKSDLVTDPKHFRRMLWMKFVLYFGSSALMYSMIYWVEVPWVFILVFVGYGLVSLLFGFNFSHDFSHNTIFDSKRANHLGFVVMYTLLGAHAEAWKKRHIHEHHFAPNVEGFDPDMKITTLIRVMPDRPLLWFHRFQHLYAPLAYTVYSLFWIFIKDFLEYFGTKQNDWQKHLSFWLQKSIYLIYILGLPLCFSHQHYPIVLLGFLCMHLTQSIFLLFTFFMTHHVEGTLYPKTDPSGNIQTSWLSNQILSSNDMHPFSPIANFLLGGFNNHIAHHLFPHIHHHYYPQINSILYPLLSKYGITPNHTSYWGGICSHLRLLKQMGRA